MPSFTGGFRVYMNITGMCSVLLCLHVEQPVSGSEQGGSQLMQNFQNFLMLCCVYSWVQGKGKQHCDLNQMRCFLGTSDGHQVLYKQ